MYFAFKYTFIFYGTLYKLYRLKSANISLLAREEEMNE